MFQDLFSNLISSMCCVYALQQFQRNDNMDKMENLVKKKRRLSLPATQLTSLLKQSSVFRYI